MWKFVGYLRMRAGGPVGRRTGGILVIIAVCTAGCASMGPKGATRLDAAKALGLPASDVILLSRDYEIKGSGDNTLALDNYTVKTRSNRTYTCTLVSSRMAGHLPVMQPVCVPKD